MRSADSITVLLFFLTLSPAYPGQSLKVDDLRARTLNFETVDYAPLVQEARRFHSSQSEGEVNSLVKANFQFIFLNQLNQRSFLATPDPSEVIGVIREIIRLNDEISGLISEGRKNVAEGAQPRRRIQIVREVRRTAERMKKIYTQYFLEVRKSSYRLSFTVFDADSVQFVHFLLQASRIHQQLSTEIESYFFNPVPGQIDVTRLDASSLPVLCDSMAVLSSMTDNSLN